MWQLIMQKLIGLYMSYILWVIVIVIGMVMVMVIERLWFHMVI